MRQGQQNRRGRGRSSNSNSNSNNSNNNNNNSRKPQNPLSRTYESSGPDVKIRGTAAQIAEKYVTLARDASSSSDVIMAENYFQHAEHYNRIIMAAQVQQPQQPPLSASGHHVQENGHDRGHDRGHGNSLPQRISPEVNGALRDQPQPVITFDEAPAAATEAIAEEPPVQAAPRESKRERARESARDSSCGEEGTRRRRRRYPANGTGDRSASGPSEADGADVASDVVKSDRSPDEVIA